MRSARSKVAAALAVPQMIFAGSAFSGFFLWSALCVPTALRHRPRDQRIARVLAPLQAMIALSAVVTVFSPNIRQGTNLTIQLCLFWAIVVLALRAFAAGGEGAVLRWLAPGVLFEVLLVVVFRLRPDIERSFWGSTMGDIFIGRSNIRHLLTDSPNNVLDAAKAGGVFLNGNVASMFLGVCACVYLAQTCRTGNRRWLLLAAACVTGVVFTGSKTGLALAVSVPAIAMLLPILVGSNRRRGIVVPLMFVGLIGALSAFLLSQTVGGFAGRSQAAFASRTAIWRASWHLFQQAPILGLGYGGWDQVFPTVADAYGIDRLYPPHSLPVLMWSQLGLAGVVLMLAFVYRCLKAGVLAVQSAQSRTEKLSCSASMCALLWVWLHSLGDNTSIYGEIHTIVPLGFALAALLWQQRSRESLPESEQEATERAWLPR